MNDPRKTRAQAQFGVAVDDYASSDSHARGDSLRALLESTHSRPD